MATTAAMTSRLGPLGPGFIGGFDANSQRYFAGSAPDEGSTAWLV